ncbi:molybdopterin molybdotransferase MoeA [Streptomyces sp. NPDC005969]|uniref:molybdopterin molybdotransferase MoeA n=1 Tax=Streptomyces sp. NPDC005969 TaxID=3156722 RepID=UPI0033DE10A7
MTTPAGRKADGGAADDWHPGPSPDPGNRRSGADQPAAPASGETGAAAKVPAAARATAADQDRVAADAGRAGVAGEAQAVSGAGVAGAASAAGQARAEDEVPNAGGACAAAEARAAEQVCAAAEACAAERARAAEEDRAVDQALALVGRRSPREPRSVAQPQPRAGFSEQSPRQGSGSGPRQSPDHSLDHVPGQGPGQGSDPDPVQSPGPGPGPSDHPVSDHGAGHYLTPESARDPRVRDRRADVQRRHATAWGEARALAARAGRSASPRTVRLTLDRAIGRVLAEPLAALADLPSFDTSAMDGWVVAGPGPWTLRRGEDAGQGLCILAGHSATAPLPDGDAVRIATGARIPANATAVIRSEHAHTDQAKGLLYAQRQVVPGQDIRPRGQECRSGDQLLPAGTVVTPAVLGLSAAAGYDELLTVARPRVDVLVLGDELLTTGLPHDGLIRDALGPMIGPWLRAMGVEVSAPRRLGDDREALRHALTTSDADLVITTGGTAAGPVDHVHPVLAEIGAELVVDGVAVRPGHPMLLTRLTSGGPYLVGLPGNPLAAISGLLTLAEPLLRGLAGQPVEDPYRVVLRDEVHGHPHDTRLVPVVHRVGAGSGSEHVVPLHYNGPAMLRGIAAADGLAVVPPGGVRSGTEVEILDLPWASATPWTEGCFT